MGQKDVQIEIQRQVELEFIVDNFHNIIVSIFWIRCFYFI
jgi:hypothetical protein